MLPTVPSDVILTKTLKIERWETQKIGPYVIGGKGQDSTYRTGYGLTPKQIEDGCIIDKAAQEAAQWDDNGGDGNGGSSCSGFDPRRFTDTYAAFNIQLGHTQRGFRKSDAYQNCRVWVAVRRKQTVEQPQEPEIKHLDWLKDVDFDLPENMTSYKMAMKLYTGKSFTFAKEDEIPSPSFKSSKTNNPLSSELGRYGSSDSGWDA